MWGKESERVRRMREEDEGMGIRTNYQCGREPTERFKGKMKRLREESDNGTGTMITRY